MSSKSHGEKRRKRRRNGKRRRKRRRRKRRSGKKNIPVPEAREAMKRPGMRRKGKY